MTSTEDSPVVMEDVQGLSLSLGRPPRILIAEDDEEVRWSLATLFELHGFEVVAVANGVEFLERVAGSLLCEQRWQAPDAIITDLRMPGFHVLNVIEGLRASGWQTPVVVISGMSDPKTRCRVEQLNAKFFAKPIELDQLEKAVVAEIQAHGKIVPTPPSAG